MKRNEKRYKYMESLDQKLSQKRANKGSGIFYVGYGYDEFILCNDPEILLDMEKMGLIKNANDHMRHAEQAILTKEDWKEIKLELEKDK